MLSVRMNGVFTAALAAKLKIVFGPVYCTGECLHHHDSLLRSFAPKQLSWAELERNHDECECGQH